MEQVSAEALESKWLVGVLPEVAFPLSPSESRPVTTHSRILHGCICNTGLASFPVAGSDLHGEAKWILLCVPLTSLKYPMVVGFYKGLLS